MKKFFQNIKFKKISLTTLALALVVSGFLVWGKTEATISIITLTSPTGGEVWSGIKNITWTTDPESDPGNVNIYLISGGSSSSIVTGKANDGTYSWDTTAHSDGSSYKIRVVSSADPANIQDESSSTFEIDNTAPTIPTTVHIESNNTTTTLAKAGDTVTVTATVDSGTTVSGTIGGQTATGSVDGTTATLTRVLDGTETEGAGLDFTLVSTDTAGNNATTVTATTDSSAVETDFHVTANFSSATDDVGSVTGTLTTGDTTDDTALVLAGTNEAGSTVAVYNGETSLGSATVTGTGWTYEATVADGITYQFNVIETDAAGNVSSATADFTVIGDMSVTANFTSATDDAGSVKRTLTSGDTTDDTSLSLAGTNEAGSTVAVYNGAIKLGDATIGGTSWSYEATVADGTTYQFNVIETDAAGNVSSATSNFTVIGDTTAPTGYSVTFDQAYVNNANKAAISFTFAGAEVGATYNYSIDDTNGVTPAVIDTGTISAATDKITGIDVNSLDDETLTITVTLTDPAGNVGAEGTNTIVKDTVAPTVTNAYIATTGNNGTGSEFKNGDIINVSWNNSDEGDNNVNIASVTVDFREFGGEATVVATNTENIWSATYTLPADVNLTGKKVLVTATDTAGNPTTTADGDTYNVDTEKPTVTIDSVTANPTNGDIAVTVEFSEATSDFVIGDISVTGGVAEDFVVTDGDSYTFNVDPNDGASVAVSISIDAGVATDAAGNTNIASNVLSYTSDTVAPTLPDTGIVGTTIQGASDTITLTFDGLVEPTDGTWSSDEFEEIESPNGTAKTLTGATFSPSSGATTTLTITFAEDSTNLQTYLRNENIITVKPTSSKIKDSAGNFVANSEIVGTTLIEGDSEVPTATSITYSQGGTEVDVINPSTRGQTVLVTVTFSESMHSAPTITIDAQGSDADKTTTMTRTSGTVWYINNWSVPSIDAVQGEATVSFSGTDLAGTAYNSASTSVVIDSMAPKITNLDTVSIATTSATLTATTNEIATCKYSTATRDYTNMTAMTTSNGLTHTVALSSLEAGKTYNYYVKCADNYGNSMQAPEPVSFTTSVDNIAPTAPVITTTAATVNSDYYTISGTVTADATSRQMISIYGESNFLGTSIVPKNGTTWSLVVELPQGISTTFKATSTDDFENTSVDSNTVVITESVSAGSDIVAPTAPVITTSATTINSDYYKIAGTVTADANSKQIVNVLVESEVYGTAIVPKGGTNWSVIVSLPQDTATTFIAKSTDDSGNISNASAGVIITEQQGNGSFGIIERTMTKMTGTADNTYANGWEWIIRVTLPTDQNSFALKFNDWVSGANTMAAGGNMQYYSEQIADGTGSSDSPIAITTANTYPSKVEISTDVDPTLDGIQTDIHVQVKIPTTTPAGSYSTSFQAFYDEPID